MNRIENIKDKLRIVRRDARGDKGVEMLASVIYELIDLAADQQAEIETLRMRLAFAAWKPKAEKHS
jgi:hypothetical protein